MDATDSSISDCDSADEKSRENQKVTPDDDEDEPVDRLALYTDGETCWNPPSEVFGPQPHPIPNLEPSSPRLRRRDQDILKLIVRDSLISQAKSRVYARFEQRCLIAGTDLTWVEFFRNVNYDSTEMCAFYSQKVKKGNAGEALKAAKFVSLFLQHVEWKAKEERQLDNATVEELLQIPDVEVDWLYVSAKMLEICELDVSPPACENLWKNLLAPGIRLPSQWSQQDFSKLKAMASRSEKRDFFKIAKEMGPGFHPYICLTVYLKYIKPMQSPVMNHFNPGVQALWCHAQVQEDFQKAMEIYNGSLRNVALWLSHSYDADFSRDFLKYAMENMKCKHGQFSFLEDAVTCVGDYIHKKHIERFPKLTDLLFWRPAVALDSRLDALRYPHYASSGVMKDWSKEEDMLLLKLVKRNRSRWANMAKYFENPKRNRKQIMARYILLRHRLRKESIEQYHARHEKKLPVPYYYLRKVLFVLNEYDEKPTVSDHSSPTDEDAETVSEVFNQLRSCCRERRNMGKPTYPSSRDLIQLLCNIPQVYIRGTAETIQEFFRTLFELIKTPATLRPPTERVKRLLSKQLT